MAGLLLLTTIVNKLNAITKQNSGDNKIKSHLTTTGPDDIS